MPYIKSHSNYVLKKRHQSVNDGTVYERDMTTIGGRDNFSPDQVPLYRSGNFVITVNNDDNVSKSIVSTGWEKNNDGEVWTLDSLKDCETSDTASDSSKIELKRDYYDLRDFAYFGSCSELIRVSISDILKTFPGELYVPLIDGSGIAVHYIDETEYNGGSDEANPDYDDSKRIKRLGGPSKILVDNPFGIDIHSEKIKDDESTAKSHLKFFANDGYKNYVAIDHTNGEAVSALTWSVNNFVVGFDEEGNEIYDDESHRHCIGNKIAEITLRIFENENLVEGSGYAFSVDKKNVADDDCKPINTTLKFDENGKGIKNGVAVESTRVSGTPIVIEAYLSNNNQVVYLIDRKNYLEVSRYSFRPKEKYFKEFLNGLDSFEKILMNPKSSPKYTATLNIMKENDYGYYTELEDFTFPTTYGGYNIGSTGPAFEEYVGKLSEIATFYDERFCDNMYRSMTHESIKNFDWTYLKRNSSEDTENLEQSADKVAKTIRLFGRQFDELLAYIDNISKYNAVTYDNINNLPDYFFTDALENDGWDVKQVTPYSLSEYVIEDGEKRDVTISTDDQAKDEEHNSYNNLPLHRVFTQNASFTVTPYSKRLDSYSGSDGYFFACYEQHDTKTDYTFKVNNADAWDDNNVGTITLDRNQTYGNITVESAEKEVIDENSELNCEYGKLIDKTITGDTYIDCAGVLRNRIRNYSSENDWTMTEVNNEFMKRLILNSKNLWRHKGTQESVEMVLAMFGMRSKRWFTALTESQKDAYGKIKDFKKYDYEIKEYTSFARRIEDHYVESLNDYNYDWVNQQKEISYGTDEYYPYQGLMVNYRESNGVRYLYPDFQKDVVYDGNPYYQMNGGWLSTSPYIFDKDDNLLVRKDDMSVFQETLRNIRSVPNITGLLGISSQSLSDGDIVYVNDLSGSYAIADGIVYELHEEYDGDALHKYFEVEVQEGNVFIGLAYFDDYVVVSDPYSPYNKRKYVVSEESNYGTKIKVYVINDEDNRPTIYAYSDGGTVSTFTLFENGKYMEGENFTHYFRINNAFNSNEISAIGWEQLKDDSSEFYSVNSKRDYYLGNNPHTGRLHYDNGHEYFTYLSNIFKYAVSNDLFNVEFLERHPDYGKENNYLPGDVETYGFKGLIDSDGCNIDYEDFLVEDSKIHYFGDWYAVSHENANGTESPFSTYDIGSGAGLGDLPGIGGSFTTPISSFTYSTVSENLTKPKGDYGEYVYNLACINPASTKLVFSECGYGCNGDSDVPIDGVRNQIVNNKVIKVIFYLRDGGFYSTSALEEMKYLQTVVVPYMTQMIPSGAILGTEYRHV